MPRAETTNPHTIVYFDIEQIRTHGKKFTEKDISCRKANQNLKIEKFHNKHIVKLMSGNKMTCSCRYFIVVGMP